MNCRVCSPLLWGFECTFERQDRLRAPGNVVGVQGPKELPSETFPRHSRGEQCPQYPRSSSGTLQAVSLTGQAAQVLSYLPLVVICEDLTPSNVHPVPGHS